MTDQTTGRSDPAAPHAAYITAVVEALARKGIRVEQVEIRPGPPLKASMTVVEVDAPDNTVVSAAEWVRLLWTPRAGWGWLAKYENVQQAGRPVYHGFSAVPRPDAVAAWVHVAMTHPEVQLDQEGGPFDTPDLEQVLRGYAVTSR